MQQGRQKQRESVDDTLLPILPFCSADFLLFAPDPGLYPFSLQVTWLGYPNTTGTAQLLDETIFVRLQQSKKSEYQLDRRALYVMCAPGCAKREQVLIA